MGAHYGSMSVVFANLSQQIESYRTVGPPSISKALMSEEDHEFAEKFKKLEMQNDFDLDDLEDDNIR